MLKRVFSLLMCLVLFAGFCALSENSDTAYEVQSLIDGIHAFYKTEAGAKTEQEWIDTSLAGNAGNSSEWFIIALAQSGNYDFSSYRQNLLSYIEKNNPSSKVTKQKYALALISAGYASETYVKEAADTTIGAQGIMSWIYGLNLLTNGIESAQYTQNAVVDTLLSKQFSDGGWALSGKSGNIDITAMAVQALAPYASGNENVKSAVDRALEFMSSLQLPDGTYESYGVANPESAAQVLCSLSSLNIDFSSDTRFIKNGNTLLDGIVLFRLENGSFSHTLGGQSNATASVQVLYSLISWQRMKEGKTPFYVFDGQAAKAESDAETDEAYSREDFKGLSYKAIAAVTVSALFVIVSILLVLFKKTAKKNFIALFIVSAILIAAVMFIDIESSSSYYSDSSLKKENPIGSVKMSIRCDTVSGKTTLEHIPKDGVILKETEFAIEQGDTVYRILTDAARAYGLHIEKSGAAGMYYVSGINYLYEFDFGDLSGWNYFINGETVSVGCDQYVLKDGDKIEWLYTTELGNDLK